MTVPERRILVAQIGARRHYSVPLALHAEGWLHRFCTDACADLPPWNLLHRAWPHRLPMPHGLRSLADRKLSDVPLHRIIGFPWFALLAPWDRRPGETQTDIWARRNARFCRLVALEGLESVDTVYAFNGAALEIFREAKRLGLRTILDQTAAPWRWNTSLLLAESNRWPGWEQQPAEIDHSGLLSRREEEEWERADHIICGSAFSRVALLETAGKSLPCSVVPYPCTASLRPVAKAVTSSVQPAAHRDEFRILFVGTFQLRKGLPYLLAALRLLNDPRLRVRLVGPSLLSAAAMEQLAALCDVVGPVPRSDVHKHYAWADVFVLPTLSEGSANVVYEALSAGLPVITTPAAGSIIQHGVDGFIVPPRSASELAEAIHLLLHSREMRQTLVSNASHSLAHHDWQTYQKRLVSCVS